MTDTLIELAERCEKATGPDRELDCAIAVAVGIDIGRSKGDPNDSRVPAYTGSLDAAMTLVLEGRGWCIDTREYCCAQVGRPDALWWDAATPALALTAAALRAIAAKEGSLA